MYARVIVDITHEKLDKVFEYRIPCELEGSLQVGTEVVVPFGKGNRETHGYVIGITDTCEYAPEKVKDILRLAKKKMAIEGRLVALAAWMRENYGGTMIQSLKTTVPTFHKGRDSFLTSPALRSAMRRSSFLTRQPRPSTRVPS